MKDNWVLMKYWKCSCGVFNILGTTCQRCNKSEQGFTITTGEYKKIDHPQHYAQHPVGIECIDVIEYFCFNLGNVIKYVWRCGLKPDTSEIEELQKARWYLDREIEKLEKEIRGKTI